MLRAISRSPLQQRGFTLVELLVALALLAITSALAFRGITAVGEHRNRVEGQRLRSVQIEQTFSQLQADMDHLMTMSGASSSLSAPPLIQRADGIILLRRPRALVADTVTQATANEATIDVIRYQTSSNGLVRTVLGRARDPIDLVGRILMAPVTANEKGESTDGLSRVTLLPEARAIQALAWSVPTEKGTAGGGDWTQLNEFNNNYNNPENNGNQAIATGQLPAGVPAPAPVASAPAQGASSAAALTPAATAKTPRALKVRITLENGAILERIYMAGPSA